MRTFVRLTIYGFVAWTLFHLWEIMRDHSRDCDGCGYQPWSEGWVIAARIAAWLLAVLALGRADDAPTRTRVGVAMIALGVFATAMLALPTPPFVAGGG